MQKIACLAIGVALICVGYIQAAEIPSLEIKGHTAAVNFASFSQDGTKIVTASVDKTARIWDAVTGKELKKLEGHTDEVNTAMFSPDGKKIVTASWDTTARIWDANSGEELKQFSGQDAMLPIMSRRIIRRIRNNPLGLLFLTSGWKEQKSIRCASFSPDGKEIVVALNASVRILNAESGEECPRLAEDFVSVLERIKSRSGAKNTKFSLFSRVLQTKPLQSNCEYALEKSGLWEAYGPECAFFSPDGERIIVGCGGGWISVWDAKSGSRSEPDIRNLSGAQIRFVNYSPDGKQVVAACYCDIYFWDADSGKELRAFRSSKFEWRGEVCSVNFSPDGRKIAIATEDGIRRITPDGEAVIGGRESILWIADVESGKVFLKLEGHTAQVLYAEFSPDGKKVVTASADNTARIWTLE